MLLGGIRMDFGVKMVESLDVSFVAMMAGVMEIRHLQME